MNFQPSEAIIAITLKCNSRCLMCDIWKKRSIKEVKPEFYKKLPSSLKEINITGGEPFLKNDLIKIVQVMHQTCPQARLLINTNGFLYDQIKKVIPEIITIDPKIAIRISLDGWGEVHNKIRGVKNGFAKAIKTLNYLKPLIKDLGVSFTLMEINKQELLRVARFCLQQGLNLSLTLASNSIIYFGKKKNLLRPKKNNETKKIFNEMIKLQYQSSKVKDWFRAWFNQGLYKYFFNERRIVSCKGGDNFFYLNPSGKVYVCQLKPWLIGNLRKKSFNKIFHSRKANKFRIMSNQCNSCWMICNVRNNIKRNIIRIGVEVIINKLKYLI